MGVAFGNPVVGVIRPQGSPLIVGSYRVTCDFACHMSRPVPIPGIDINDATCGQPVVAMKAGTISLVVPGKVGSTASIDASIVRVNHGVLSDGATYESGYGHLKIKAGLAKGQRVAEGDLLGTVDKIGASACHLHGGMKRNGVEIDYWPLLRQNGATEDDVLQGTNPQRIVNRQSTVKANDTNFRSSPFVRNDNKLVQFAAGAAFYPDWAVDGTQVGASKRWYGGWGNVGTGKEFGYFHESVLNPLSPIEASGHSDADLAAAVKKGSHNAAVAVSNAALNESLKYPG